MNASTNGHSKKNAYFQDIVDAEFLEKSSNHATIPPQFARPKPTNPTEGLDQPLNQQQLSQFEQRLEQQIQTWHYQQIQTQERDRHQARQQLWEIEERTEKRLRYLHEQLKRTEHKLDRALHERHAESSRRSIFVMLGVFVVAIAYVTVIYPLLHRPSVPTVAPQAPLPPAVQPQNLTPSI